MSLVQLHPPTQYGVASIRLAQMLMQRRYEEMYGGIEDSLAEVSPSGGMVETLSESEEQGPQVFLSESLMPSTRIDQ